MALIAETILPARHLNRRASYLPPASSSLTSSGNLSILSTSSSKLRMPSNTTARLTAAWLTAAEAHPLEVKSAPYTSPHENEIVIKNGAVAINPVNWMKQDDGGLPFSWIKFPFFLGTDCAREVVDVGRAVTHFKVGDRVVGHANGIDQNLTIGILHFSELYSSS